MNLVSLTARPSALRRVNLTRYVSLITRYAGSTHGMKVVAFPSEAYLNTDGTVSVSSRKTETGFSRVRMENRVFYGVTANGTLEGINLV